MRINDHDADDLPVKAKQPHGSSLAIKPIRLPHPIHNGRDIHGRLLPGKTLPGAAPPFTAKAATAKAIALPKVPPPPTGRPQITPMPKIALSPPPPPLAPRGGPTIIR